MQGKGGTTVHYRLSAVLIAGLVAFAGSESQFAPPEPTAPRVVAQAVPATISFDDLPLAGPTTTTAASQERVTITTKPLPRPATKPAHPVTKADLDRAGVLAEAYRSAAAAAPKSCNLPVALLAAIGQIESGSAGGRKVGSDHLVRPGIFGPLLDGGPFAVIRDSDGGRYDGDSEWDRAVGPMQFIPSTWATSGVDGDGDRKADPQNVYDAAHSAAGYLCNHGRDLSKQSDLRAAIWAYNQSTEYVAAVLEWLDYFDDKGLEAVGSVGFNVASGGRASELKPVAATRSASKSAKPRTTAASTPSKTRAAVTPAPVTTTPSSTTGTGTTNPTTGSPSTTTDTPTTGTTDGTATPEPTDTETCPTGEPTPSTTTTPSPTTTTAPDPTTSGPTPTTACDTTPTTATPTTTATTAGATSTTAAATGTSGTTSTDPGSPTSSTP